MSYQVIARKWRPQTFEEVTGQENITQTLRNAIEHDRLHHAYLFSGARGVGKTTTARLLAKALNCHRGDAPTVTPCRADDPDACASCLEIAESRSIDVLEIDAASHTGVQDVRDTILEGINVAAARDRFKVFVIDEVHMLSRASFNALLKSVEEPPPNVVFIMATTELHKVPETILSRCQEFEFRTIPLKKIFDRLKAIADAEGITISDEALKELARSGEGSMRDAQSNFDQVITFSGSTIEIKDVTGALGLAGSAVLVRLLNAIADASPRVALEIVDDLTARGHDLRSFCRDLMSLFRDLLVFKVAGEDEKLADTATVSPAEMRELAARFSESDLIRFFNAVAETESKLREATQARYVLEIGLVRLIEMRRVTDVTTLLKRLGELEGRLGTEAEIAQAAGGPEKKTSELADPRPQRRAESSKEEREERSRGSANGGSYTAPRSEPPFEPPLEPPFAEPDPPPQEFDPTPTPPAFSYAPAAFTDRFPAKSDITSAELEHADDAWLDAALDRVLTGSGESLRPLATGPQLAARLLDRGSNKPALPAHGGAAGTSAAAAKLVTAPTPGMAADTARPAPELPPDATDEQLLEYARADPSVKFAIKLFGAKIVSVKRSDNGNK